MTNLAFFTTKPKIKQPALLRYIEEHFHTAEIINDEAILRHIHAAIPKASHSGVLELATVLFEMNTTHSRQMLNKVLEDEWGALKLRGTQAEKFEFFKQVSVINEAMIHQSQN